MTQSGLFAVAVIALMAVSIPEISALRCWKCSSDASNAAFCNDPFDSSIITDQQRRWSFVECANPPGYSNPYGQSSNQIAVCKKDTKIINGKIIVSRSCFWQRQDAPKNECFSLNTPSYIRTEFCETCTTEGCNGAAQYGPIALLLALPIAIAKLFALL